MGQNTTATIENIEGMDTVWEYEAEEDMELDMTYLINVKSGKVKLVLISPDNSVTTLVEMTSESEMTDNSSSVLSIEKGKNRIKIVAGEDTALEFGLEISEGKFKELGN